ncbi:uncharacterized protein LOC117576496 [Drosophila albomicans]|uniref:Uncharacterized protein LOC117576496 n=1 Tax=Drosophila albomicans TaxID=7291 RepID=A0A6P8XKR2_DROAB|nr:uncharacterized protein LOC117576496 [Drosophila albomicans]
MLRMHFGAGQPVYHSGTWSWNNETDSLHFEPHTDLEDSKDRYIETNGYRFLRTLNAVEENVFRQEYTQSQPEYEVVVSINDVRDLVLFLMPKEFMRMRFVDFMHKPAVDKLLHALIIYFEYFLRMVEFVLIRRDEVEGSMSQIQSEQTNELKRICSIHLSQYRMLVARNYSVILKGEGDMAEFYHMKQSVHISATLKDRTFHKHFLAVAIQIVWITMHRRAYHVIEMEMNRLFGSEHFIGQHPEYIKFSAAERSLLYGRRNKIVNYRLQRSPLIQELEHVADEDLPILWIGERLYRGNNIRIASIELEYIVPDTQLRMIDVAHGILGNPKRFFNTILELNWPALRKENYSLTNDPYHLIRQPSLRVPNIKSRRDLKLFKNYEHFLKISQIYEPVPRHRLLKWLQRENKLSSSRIDDTPNIYTRCENELASKTIGPNVTQIIHNYFEIVTRFRKEITDDKDKDKESYASLRF